MSHPFILLPGEARCLELGTFQALVVATDDQTSGEFTLLQTQREPPDFGPPMHLHRDAAEAFYVLEGEYLMYVEDGHELCPPGTFVYVPRAVPHTFKVVSSEPGKKLNLFSPRGYGRLLRRTRRGRSGGNRGTLGTGHDRCEAPHGGAGTGSRDLPLNSVRR